MHVSVKKSFENNTNQNNHHGDYFSHGEKLWTRMRINRLDFKNICKENGDHNIRDLYRSSQKIRHISVCHKKS
jgi:hypothetical protein